MGRPPGIKHKVDVKGASQEKYAGSTHGIRITVDERKHVPLTFPFLAPLMVSTFLPVSFQQIDQQVLIVFSTDRIVDATDIEHTGDGNTFLRRLPRIRMEKPCKSIPILWKYS